MRVQKIKVWLMPLLTGAVVFQSGGCDPTIRDTVFAGIQSATVGLFTTFINALFLAIQPNQAVASAQDAAQVLIEAVC